MEKNPVKLPQPFQNQNASRAHSLRKDMFTVLREPLLSPSKANSIVQDLLNSYRKSFDSVGGRNSKKQPLKNTRNADFEIPPNQNHQRENAPVMNTYVPVNNFSRPEDFLPMDDEDWSIEPTPANARRSGTANAKSFSFSNTRNPSLYHEDDVLRQVDNAEANETETDESETLTPFTTPLQGKPG